MNFAWYVANRITFKSKRTFSKLIVRIAVIGIMLGLGVMILSMAVVRGFKKEIREKIRGFSGDMVVVKYDLNNSYENSPFKVDSGFVNKALATHLVTRIMPFATKPGIIKSTTDIEGIELKGVDKNYDWIFFRKNMVSGKVLDFSDTIAAKKQLLISQTLANRLRLKVGDKVLIYFVQEPLRVRPFIVRGIFSFGLDEVDKTYVIGDMSVIRRVNDWDSDEIGGYELKISNFDRLKATASVVDNLLPTRLKEYTVVDNYPSIFEWLGLLDGNTNVVLALMIIVAVINMISALMIMILERTTMVGMLKAMGATNWGIQKIFLYNAFYLIGAGMLLGDAFGLGIGFFQYKTHFFTLDPASYYMNFVPILFKWTDVLLLNAGTLIVCLLVMVLPSMLVTKITPVKAIRFK